jgi:hypothetical protein
MDQLLSELNSLVSNLTNGQFARLVASGQNGRLTEEEISEAIKTYPGKMNYHAADKDSVNVFYYSKSDTSGIIEYELYFDGIRSDLTLSCEFDLARAPILTIESIHVL